MTRPGFQRVARVVQTAGAPVGPSYTMPTAEYIGIWDAANYTDGGVGAVATLTDTSSAGCHLTQSTEARKPTKGTDAFGTYITTDGGDCVGKTSDLPAASSTLTMITVFIPTVAAKSGVINSFSGGIHRDAYVSQTDNNKPGWTYASYYYFGQDTNYSTTTPTIVTYQWENASLTCRINGSFSWTDTNSKIVPFTTVDCITIFCEANPYRGGSYAYGANSGTKLYFWSVWKGTDISKLYQAERYCANRYGVTIP